MRSLKNQLGEVYELILNYNGLDIEARVFRMGNTWYFHNYFYNDVRCFDCCEYQTLQDVLNTCKEYQVQETFRLN